MTFDFNEYELHLLLLAIWLSLDNIDDPNVISDLKDIAAKFSI